MVRIAHGYDDASNRTWREDAVAAANSKNFDEFYSYDGLRQLTALDRGDLKSDKTGIDGTPFYEEDFALEPLGNWTDYLNKAYGTPYLDQDRTHNRANEITQIDSSSTHVAHDAAGNMTKVPTSWWSAHYDLVWDAWNRLVEVKDGENTVPPTSTTVWAAGFPNHSGGQYPPPDPRLINFSSNEPLRGTKGQPYEGGIRVPALANWPGRLEPRKVTAPVHAIDWMPTLCNLLGYKPEKDLKWDGQDVWPLVNGEKSRHDGPRRFYWNYWNVRIALRDGDWKLAYPKQKAPAELYNLANDPSEKHDLAQQRPDQLKRLQRLLEEEQARDRKGRAPWLEPLKAKKLKWARNGPEPGLCAIVASSGPPRTDRYCFSSRRIIALPMLSPIRK